MKKSLGQVFSSAWSTAKSNFLALFLSTLIYTLILSLLTSGVSAASFSSATSLAYGSYTPNPGFLAAMTILPLLTLCAALFLTPLYMGFSAAIIHNYTITGHQTSYQTAWKKAKETYIKYLTALLVTMLFAIPVFIIAAVIMVFTLLGTVLGNALPSFSYTAYSLSWFIPAFIPIFAIAFLFMFAINGINFIPVAEQKGAFQAFFASLKYMFKGNFWRNLGHFTIISLIVYGINAIINALLSSGMGYMVTQFPGIFASAIILGIISSVVSTFSTSFHYEIYRNARFSSDVKEQVKRLQAGSSGSIY